MVKQGFAKTAFTKLYSTAPWKPYPPSLKALPSWPLLEELVDQNKLSPNDTVLIDRLFKRENIPQETALFLCHLILAAKEGHLCVHVKDGVMTPSILQIWKNREGSPLLEDEAAQLSQIACTGAQFLMAHRLAAIHVHQDNFYLKKYWDYESQFLAALKRHMECPPTIQINNNDLIEKVEMLCKNGKLQPEQGDAVIKGCSNSFMLLSGGPGTGKTYTAGQLIKIFWSQLSHEQKENFEIVLAAPTGKAAANLHNSLLKAIEDEEDFPSIQAKTLHGLLGIKSNSVPSHPTRLTADLLLVDESSMLDVRLAASLLSAAKPGSRLILLGDQHQLPSVDAGSIFADLTRASQNSPSHLLPCTQLNKCLRTDINALVEFAQSIRTGNHTQIFQHLKNGSMAEVNLFPLASQPAKAQHQIIQKTLESFSNDVKSNLDEKDLLNQSQSFRLLSPLRLGPFGFDTLNQLIWNAVSKRLHSDWIAIPIIIISNDHKEELFNGDTGILIRQLPLQSVSSDDYALFQGRNGQRSIRKLSAALLPRYEYAYCLSVHKSQGSEFDHVSLVLPQGASHMGREVLYTAVTRARKQIDIHTTDEILLETIENQALRQSGIFTRINA